MQLFRRMALIAALFALAACSGSPALPTFALVLSIPPVVRFFCSGQTHRVLLLVGRRSRPAPPPVPGVAAQYSCSVFRSVSKKTNNEK
jgi:hypothetical protein